MESITVLRRRHLVFANTTRNTEFNQNKHETKVSTHSTSFSVKYYCFASHGGFFIFLRDFSLDALQESVTQTEEKG